MGKSKNEINRAKIHQKKKKKLGSLLPFSKERFSNMGV